MRDLHFETLSTLRRIGHKLQWNIDKTDGGKLLGLPFFHLH